MPETPASAPHPDEIAWQQQTALLDTTLATIIRVAQEMRDGLRKSELDLARADRLGHATLVVVKQAAAISERAVIAARAA